MKSKELADSTCPSMNMRSISDTMKVQHQVRKLLEAAEDPLHQLSSKKYRDKAELLLKSRSITSQTSALFLWPFVTLHPSLNLYEALSFEPMHNLLLGVGKMIKQLAGVRLTSKELFSTEMPSSKGFPRPFASIRRRVLSCVNRMLKLIQKDSPAARFNVDFSTGKNQGELDGFYSSEGIVGILEASDMACLDQVFPFVGALIDRLCGEVEESPTTKVMTLYSDLLAQLYRRGMDPGHTESSLKNTARKIKEFKKCARALYASFQSSRMGTLKFHFLDHVVPDIERMGSLESMCASFYESAHSEVKQHYRGTSRRKNTAMEETVRRLGEGQALQRMLPKEKGGGISEMALYLAFGKRQRASSPRATFSKLETVAGGSAALVKHGKRISYEEMKEFLRSSERYAEQTASTLNEGTTLGNARKWSSPLLDLFSDIGERGLEKFCLLLEKRACQGINSSLQKRYVMKSLVVERVQSGFVASVDVPSSEYYQEGEEEVRVMIEDNGRRTLKRVVCSHSFYNSGKPRNDCIIIEAKAGTFQGSGAEGSKLFEAYFAKTLVLFRVRADYGPFSDKTEEQELVFLRYFDVMPLSDNIDFTLGCIKLRWACAAEQHEETADQRSPSPWFDIQSIGTLRGQVQVIRGDYCLESTKSFKGKNHWTDHWFYVNRFKHDSSEPAYWEEDRSGG